jgi:hypothetical protein
MTEFTGDPIKDIGIIGMELQDRLQEYFELHGDEPSIQVAGALCYMVADICAGDDILTSDLLLHIFETTAKEETDLYGTKDP